MAGTLYIVATPIGNLEDITLRALRVLKEVDLILAEDTRVTKKLLNHYQIEKSIQTYHQHSSLDTKYYILNTLAAGKNIALVTDAGTPGISDPGNELVSYLIHNTGYSIQVVPIPGPSSLTAAISVSGLDLSKFIFIGFWPKKKKTKLVSSLKELKIPFVFFESPFRIEKTLQDLEKNFGPDINIFIARELTKLHETLYRGKIEEVLIKLKKDKMTQGSSSAVKGEIVVIVELQPQLLYPSSNTPKRR